MAKDEHESSYRPQPRYSRPSLPSHVRWCVPLLPLSYPSDTAQPTTLTSASTLSAPPNLSVSPPARSGKGSTPGSVPSLSVSHATDTIQRSQDQRMRLVQNSGSSALLVPTSLA